MLIAVDSCWVFPRARGSWCVDLTAIAPVPWPGGGSLSGSHPGKACARPIVIILSLLQNYKNAVTPAEAGVQKPLTSLDSCFRRNDRKKLIYAQAAQKGPDARRRAGDPSAGWVQARGVLGPYAAAPRKCANPPTADRWAFFSSLLGQGQMIVVEYPEGFRAGSTARGSF